MSKEAKIQDFDPNTIGLDNGNLFGLPFNFEESEIIILPVPWEVTTSFRGGTSFAPQKILELSSQIDLFDQDRPTGWHRGYYMLEINQQLHKLSQSQKLKANEIIRLLEHGKDAEELKDQLAGINEACNEMNQWVYSQTKNILERGKKIGLLGGDHSCPLYYYKALHEEHGSFGILQIDAHADLRIAYEGFSYSHASIMNNTLEILNNISLHQVGIRDLCDIEYDRIEKSDRIRSFDWNSINERLFDGDNWSNICEDIIMNLPDKVVISLDIDGLDPSNCPATGTPVPGGLSYDQTIYLLKKLHRSDKEVIGFDLVEIGNAEWDAILGGRLLYKLCQFMD